MKMKLKTIRQIVTEELKRFEENSGTRRARRAINETLHGRNAVDIVGDAIDGIYGTGDDYDALRDAGNDLDALYDNDEMVGKVIENLAKISAVRRHEGEASPKENRYVNAAMKLAGELIRNEDQGL